MARDDDESLDKTVEALHDLIQLLHLSQEAAQRLKQHVPGQDFPTAYKLEKKLQVLQNAVDQIQHHVDPTIRHLPIVKPPQDLISSSDQL